MRQSAGFAPSWAQKRDLARVGICCLPLLSQFVVTCGVLSVSHLYPAQFLYSIPPINTQLFAVTCRVLFVPYSTPPFNKPTLPTVLSRDSYLSESTCCRVQSKAPTLLSDSSTTCAPVDGQQCLWEA